jgi:hypothetical protein
MLVSSFRNGGKLNEPGLCHNDPGQIGAVQREESACDADLQGLFGVARQRKDGEPCGHRRLFKSKIVCFQRFVQRIREHRPA